MRRPHSSWNPKPPVGAGIDWSHPLAAGLADLLLLNEQAGSRAVNLADPRFPANAGANGIRWQGTPQGTSLRTSAASADAVTIADHINIVAGDFTVRVLHRPVTWPNAFTNLFAKGIFTAREAAVFFNTSGVSSFCSIGNATVTLSPASAAMAAGAVHDTVLTRRGTTASLYINGRLQSTGTSSSTARVAGALFYLGDDSGVGAGSSYNGNYLTAAVWVGRSLTAAEVQWLYQEPYAFILPLRVTRAVDVAAAPTGVPRQQMYYQRLRAA